MTVTISKLTVVSGYESCQECGMPVDTGEYHPYAACLIFKGCNDAETARANMSVLQKNGWKEGMEQSAKICIDAPATVSAYECAEVIRDRIRQSAK